MYIFSNLPLLLSNEYIASINISINFPEFQFKSTIVDFTSFAHYSFPF